MISCRSRRLLVVSLLVTLVAASAGCSHRKRAAQAKSLLSGEETYARAMDELGRRRLTKAKSLLEGIQFTAENRSRLEPLVRLAMADVLFYTGDSISLIDARSKYIEFATLYGDHPKAPYAQFQTGVCSMAEISGPSRDQSQTRVSITDFRDVDRRYPDSPYAPAARATLEIAERNLAEHEYQVGRYYMQRKAYFAAAERFRGILENYPRFSEKQKVYLELGRALILTKNSVEGTIYLDKLVSDYPGDARTAEARRLLASVGGGMGTGVKAGESPPR